MVFESMVLGNSVNLNDVYKNSSAIEDLETCNCINNNNAADFDKNINFVSNLLNLYYSQKLETF